MDVTIICGSRPQLLSQTIDSFKSKLLDNFDLGTVFANIDPFCGTNDDGKKCEELLNNAFNSVSITKPKTASFGLAVKNLWSKPKSPYFFHLEDDWKLLHSITPEDIEGRFSEEVVQQQLSPLQKPYLPHKFSYEVKWVNMLGMKFIKRTNFNRPLFTTSPSFLNLEFAKECAALMDPEKDPEKQLYKPETKLGNFTTEYRNWPLTGPNKTALVRDLGRQWLSERGIKKEIIDDVSHWSHK